jgi:hypothetical protein
VITTANFDLVCDLLDIARSLPEEEAIEELEPANEICFGHVALDEWFLAAARDVLGYEPASAAPSERRASREIAHAE